MWKLGCFSWCLMSSFSFIHSLVFVCFACLSFETWYHHVTWAGLDSPASASKWWIDVCAATAGLFHLLSFWFCSVCFVFVCLRQAQLAPKLTLWSTMALTSDLLSPPAECCGQTSTSTSGYVAPAPGIGCRTSWMPGMRFTGWAKPLVCFWGISWAVNLQSTVLGCACASTPWWQSQKPSFPQEELHPPTKVPGGK